MILLDKQPGFTLIELMLTVAVLAILSAIAIPLYQGYIETSRLGAARMNAGTLLRVFLEDFQLDNGTYIATSGHAGTACTPATVGTYLKGDLEDCFGWKPEGDKNAFTYKLVATSDNWKIDVQHTASGTWLHCDDRMSTCCDGTSGSAPAACP